MIPAQTVGLLDRAPSVGFLSFDVDVSEEWAIPAVLATVFEYEAAGGVGYLGDFRPGRAFGPFAPEPDGALIVRAIVERDVSIELPPWEPDLGAVTVRLRATWEPA